MEDFILSEFTQELVQLISHIKEQQRNYEISLEDKKTQLRSQESLVEEESVAEEDDYEMDSFIGSEQEQEGDRSIGLISSDDSICNKPLDIWQIPLNPGRKQPLNCYATEFIKFIFDTLSIQGQFLKDIFYSSKKECYDHLQSEFYSEEAKYKPMIYSFIIPFVICENCFIVRYVNLFDDFNMDAKGYQCLCGHDYPKEYIQSKIIDQFQ